MSDTLQVRDKRANDRFFIDNHFLRGGWGAKLGPYAIAVYNAIAMHADNDTQQAWPSTQRIADLTGMSQRQVARELQELEKHHIVHIQSRAEERKPSIVSLLDKSEWLPVGTGRHMTESHMSGSPQSYDRESYELDSGTEPMEGGNPPAPAPDYLDHVGGMLQGNLTPGVSDPSQDEERHKRYKNPFCQIYYQRTGLHPESKVQRPAIEALTLDKSQDERLWEQIVVKWVRLGWNKRNVDGMLDYYQRRQVPGTGPDGNGTRPRAGPDPPGWIHEEWQTEEPDFLK